MNTNDSAISYRWRYFFDLINRFSLTVKTGLFYLNNHSHRGNTKIYAVIDRQAKSGSSLLPVDVLYLPSIDNSKKDLNRWFRRSNSINHMIEVKFNVLRSSY